VSTDATLTAQAFVRDLAALRPVDRERDDPYAGIGMGQMFGLAKEFRAMPPAEIERLLESDHHAVKVGAMAIMDWQARDRKTTPERREELFDLYIRRHDRIDTWDLVDRSAIHVVGEYLLDRPRDVLHKLATSARPMERRTAILSTYAFIRKGQLDDTYLIAETLANDPDELVAKAVGWMLREAGKRDEPRLRSFLDEHATTMPRVMLRYSIKKLDKAERDRYLGSLRRPRPAARYSRSPALKPRSPART
jgi:3-methyladenine DNA glycosylase AlkD